MTLNDPDPDFKVTIIFDIKNVKIGARQRYNYYFYINIKIYTIYRMASFTMTLDDL